MNQTSSTDDLHTGPVDDLDRLLADFFKSRMRNPWPAAPAVTSEPAVLVAGRGGTEAPRNQPAAVRDPGSRARYTLAASVALLLGTGWLLTDGFHPGPRPGPAPGTAPNGLVDGGTASDPEPLKKLREEKARNGDGFVLPMGEPKIDLP
jgi:hypothetical protein